MIALGAAGANAALGTVTAIVNLATATLEAARVTIKTAKENPIPAAILISIGAVYCRPDLAHAAIDYVIDHRKLLHHSVDLLVNTIDSARDKIAANASAQWNYAVSWAKHFYY